MQFYIIARAADLDSCARGAASLLRYRSASQVILVVPSSDVGVFRSIFLRNKRVSVHDEREFAPAIDRTEIGNWGISHFPDRAGWYYQQFLKMAVAEHASAEDRYVIWDGDTVAFRTMTCFDTDVPLFTVHQKEFHEPYFETNNLLIGFDRRKYVFRYSAVSQHMPVNKRDMLGLLALLSHGGSMHWWQTIGSAIEGRDGRSLFSEYELYHDYVTQVALRPYRNIQRRWFRFGNSCSFDQQMYLRLRFDFASYEGWDEARPWTMVSWCERWGDLRRAAAQAARTRKQ